MPVWTTCFQSWLDAARPSYLRRLLAGRKQALLEEVDNLTYSALLYTEQAYPGKMLEPWAIAEALQAAPVLNWEDEATEEEKEAEEANPLTDEETERLEALMPDE